MKILIACESSQTVCKAFREKGHLAFSCDITPCYGGYPEWHIIGDCLEIINGHVPFYTQDQTFHKDVIHQHWDMVIAYHHAHIFLKLELVISSTFTER